MQPAREGNAALLARVADTLSGAEPQERMTKQLELQWTTPPVEGKCKTHAQQDRAPRCITLGIS